MFFKLFTRLWLFIASFFKPAQKHEQGPAEDYQGNHGIPLMTTETLSPTPIQSFRDSSGAPLVGGKLFTYSAGTSTKLATYIDSTGGTPNTNPVILDSRGECRLWIPPNVGYKYVLSPSTDTDPPTNPIWTMDNIVNSQLITLYGGVDTGTANAYVLNFVANFTSYTDGIIIYWIPSHSNTATSTINVNSFGPVNILNGDGSTLLPNQLIANQVAVILCKGGNFILVNTPYGSAAVQQVNVQNAGYVLSYTDAGKIVAKTDSAAYTWTIPASIFSVGTVIDLANNSTLASGIVIVTAGVSVNLYSPFSLANVSYITLGPKMTCKLKQIALNTWVTDLSADESNFIGTWNGFSAGLTITVINWSRSGSLVTILLPLSLGTSNSTSTFISGLPAEIRPQTAQLIPLAPLEDNGSVLTTPGLAAVTPGSGNIVLYKDTSAITLWTNSGTKGISAATSFTYSLI